MRAQTPTTPARLHPRLTWAAMGTGGRGARGAQPGSPHLVLLPVFPRQRAVPRDQHTASGPCVSSLHAPHTPPLAARRSGVAAAPGGCAASPRDSSSVASARSGVPPLLASLPMALTLARVAAVPALVAGACLERDLYLRVSLTQSELTPVLSCAVHSLEAAWAPGVCFLLFVAASVTDWLDGYLARKARSGEKGVG